MLGLACLSSVTFAQDLKKVKVAMFLEHEGFLMWYAKEQGWDKELGIDIELKTINTNGIELMKKHRENPDDWDITAASTIPFLVGNHDMPLEIVGIANDESPSTSVMVRKDDDIFKVKGWNKDYPNVYGSPETIKGKTFLVNGLSSGAYTLAAWLEVFDLTLGNVVLKDCTGEELMNGLRDKDVTGAGLWSPDTYAAEWYGYQRVSTARALEEDIPIMFYAAKKFSHENPEIIAKVLATYLKAVELQKEDPEQLVKSYQQYLEKFTGHKYSDDVCLDDIKRHEIYNIKEQIEMFDDSKNHKSTLYKIERTVSTGLMMMLKDMPQSKEFKISKPDDDFINGDYLKLAVKYLE